jgi:hypothetical protein
LVTGFAAVVPPSIHCISTLTLSTEDFNIPVKENEAFLLNDKTPRKEFQERYERRQALYCPLPLTRVIKTG